MKTKWTIILVSILVAFILISGGYGFWEKELTLGGKITVQEQEQQEDLSDQEEISVDIEEVEVQDVDKEDNMKDEEVDGQIENLDTKIKEDKQEQEIQDETHQEAEDIPPQSQPMEEE